MPNYLLHLDQEQMELIDAAAEFSIKCLESRAFRVDPDKIVSDSCKLQARKLAQIRLQCTQPPLPSFDKMDDETKQSICALANELQHGSPSRKRAAFDQILALAVNHRHNPKPDPAHPKVPKRVKRASVNP